MSGLGILNPAGALAFATVAVLVALWLRDRRRRVVAVGTLFLWRQIPAARLAGSRRRLDLLFLLQLVLLLALVAGYLRPYLAAPAGPASGRRLVVVLDVSASMQAREERGTRFDLARARARTLVGDLAGSDQVMLVSAAERAHVVLRWTADHGEALDRLEALAPLDVPTDLAPALELALGEARAHPGTRVAVFTDLPLAASGGDADALAAVDYIEVGATDDNVAIASLAVDQPPFAPAAAATVTVLVRNYAHRARRAVLEARVGDDPWTRREIELPARAAAPVLLAEPPHGGLVSAALVADDALAVDDRAFGWIAPGEPLDALVVGDAPEVAAALRAVASAVAGSRIDAVATAAYAGLPAVARRAVVFDRFVPPAEPPVNALYLAPPAGNALCPVAAAVANAAVVDWETGHPVLGSLENLGAVALARALPLTTPAWGTSIVHAAAGRGAFPLLVVGERQGRRLACLGAELTPPVLSSDGLPLLMLTLATLGWLEAPADGVVLAVQTGVPVLSGSGPTAPVNGPHPAALHVAGDPPTLIAERTGVYRLGLPGTRGTGTRLVLANLFDDRESDIGRSDPREHAATAHPSVTAVTTVPREFGWWLYLAAFAVGAAEWVVWRRSDG